MTNTGSKNEIVSIPMLLQKPKLNNSDYILLFYEVCQNPAQYYLTYSNTSKNFWIQVKNHSELSQCFSNFQPETLKKYWKELRKGKSKEAIIDIIKNNREVIDNPFIKLLPMIQIVTGFSLSTEDNLQKYIRNNTNNRSLPYLPFPNNNSVAILKEELLGQKRALQNEELLGTPKKEEVEKQENNDKDNKEKGNAIESEEEILQEIIDAFHSYFVDKEKEEIFKALYRTSGKIKEAFLLLKNPEKYECLGFVKTDDYIIENLREKPFYYQLVEKKGKDLVEEREKFLGICK